MIDSKKTTYLALAIALALFGGFGADYYLTSLETTDAPSITPLGYIVLVAGVVSLFAAAIAFRANKDATPESVQAPTDTTATVTTTTAVPVSETADAAKTQ